MIIILQIPSKMSAGSKRLMLFLSTVPVGDAWKWNNKNTHTEKTLKHKIKLIKLICSWVDCNKVSNDCLYQCCFLQTMSTVLIWVNILKCWKNWIINFLLRFCMFCNIIRVFFYVFLHWVSTFSSSFSFCPLQTHLFAYKCVVLFSAVSFLTLFISFIFPFSILLFSLFFRGVEPQGFVVAIHPKKGPSEPPGVAGD